MALGSIWLGMIFGILVALGLVGTGTGLLAALAALSLVGTGVGLLAIIARANCPKARREQVRF